jgi:E3 ubiquitin-protein ligase RNF144
MEKIFSQSVCNICTSNNKTRVRLDCNHSFCKLCMSKYIETKITNFEVTLEKLTCPEDKTPISTAAVLACVSFKDYKKINRLRSYLCPPQLRAGEVHFRCTGVGCYFSLVLNSSLNEYECPDCHLRVCPRCNEPPHLGVTCESYRLWKEENAKADENFELLIKNNSWVTCPWCKFVVERISGCKYITCLSAACKGVKFFCYDCKKGLNSVYENHPCITK